jgi:hypothetical protein
MLVSAPSVDCVHPVLGFGLPFTLAKIDYPNHNAYQAKDHQHYDPGKPAKAGVNRPIKPRVQALWDEQLDRTLQDEHQHAQDCASNDRAQQQSHRQSSQSSLHQSVDCVHPAITLGFSSGLSYFRGGESNEASGEFGPLDQCLQLRDIRGVVGHERGDVAAEQLKPVMTVNAALAGFTCAGDADRVAIALRLDVIEITFRTFHSETQHHHLPKLVSSGRLRAA